MPNREPLNPHVETFSGNDSELPIVDAHVHLWDLQRFRYPWLAAIPGLNRNFSLHDFDNAIQGSDVRKIVFVQCECEPEQYRDEVNWVTELAQSDSRIEGIVSWAPLEWGVRVERELEQLAANPLIKGIRRIIQFEPDPDFCLRQEFIEGVRLLPNFGWTFDICISHHQIPNAVLFVQQCPDVRFVVDHIGKPEIKKKLMEPWRSGMQRLAEFPNVHCKLSSLATEANHWEWTENDLAPYVEHILNCFGPERIFFSGDWPVSAQAATYNRCVEMVTNFVARYGRENLKKIFAHNAIDFYKLSPITPH